jgi:hypothetical protein
MHIEFDTVYRSQKKYDTNIKVYVVETIVHATQTL